MRSALAICWRIRADGLRRPRSIWLRYGLEIPASSDSRRSDSRAELRCSRMKAPRSCQRSGSCRATSAPRVRARPGSGKQPVGACVPALVPVDDLALQLVDALVQRAAVVGDLGLDGAERV